MPSGEVSEHCACRDNIGVEGGRAGRWYWNSDRWDVVGHGDGVITPAVFEEEG